MNRKFWIAIILLLLAANPSLAQVYPPQGGGGGGGSGTVTSVGETFTGGLISVSGSPITTSGTFGLTVAGTSGGVPYFASGTTWVSSGVLAANSLLIGGGAGVGPASTTTGSGVLAALGLTLNGSGALAATTSPAFVTPNIGAATGTSVALSSGAAITLTGAFPEISNGAGAYIQVPSSSYSFVSGFNGVNEISIDNSGNTTIRGVLIIGQSPPINPISGSDATISRFAANNIHLGNADSAAPTAYTLGVQSVVAGTSNTTGALFTQTGSQGTGTGVGGDIVWKVAKAGSTGSTQNALTEAFRLDAATALPKWPSSSTGAGTATFTNSPCTGLTTEKWVPITITSQTGTWFIPACQ